MGGLPRLGPREFWLSREASPLPCPPSSQAAADWCLWALLAASWRAVREQGGTSCLVLATWLSEVEKAASKTRPRQWPSSASQTLWLLLSRARVPDGEQQAGAWQGYHHAPKPLPDFPVATHFQRIPPPWAYPYEHPHSLTLLTAPGE